MPQPLIPVQTRRVFGRQHRAGRMASQTFNHPGVGINLYGRYLLVCAEWTAFKSQHGNIL